MLVNFCDKCLRTDVSCSTISTEGYEITNLVNNSDKGFLAYSCIRPPVNIDFTFICNIQLSHILIWPQVGAQRSSGFKLSVKSADNTAQPLTDVSTGFLQKQELGAFFYRRDITHHSKTVEPPTNFAQRYIKSLGVVNYVNTLRLSILKTDNSVPALAKIEIWGSVSPRCAKDVAMNVTALWLNRFNHLPTIENQLSTDSKHEETVQEKIDENILDVPEDFLDPITLEIMTQPIILPSGKIIDQKTLEKHGNSEAVWGRPVSDPFTGIPFSNVHKPIAALPLKLRIDKFLLENSNQEEIKKLPRVLGTRLNQPKNIEVITCENSKSVNSVNIARKNLLKRTLSKEDSSSTSKKTFHGHVLPIMSLKSSRTVSQSAVPKISKSTVSLTGSVSRDDIQKTNAMIQEKLDSTVQVADSMTCKCCSDNKFYQLPCEHVICRKALLSLKKDQCTICALEFKTSDLQRFHL